MKHYIFYILAIFAAVSCAEKVTDSEIFNGEIKIIDDTVKSIVEMQGKEIIMDGITYGWPAVYDSLMFFCNYKLPNHFYIVFNLKTGKELGYFCHKGQGPGEVRSIFNIRQFYRENGDLKTLFAASMNFKFVEWNISKSIETGKTVCEFIPYEWRKDHDKEFPHSHIIRLNDKEFVGDVLSICLNWDDGCTKSTLFSFEKRTIHTNTRISEYPIYKKMLNRKESYRMFGGYTCLKPDGSKAIQFMHKLWQINTIDLETGEITGYRKRGSPDYSYLANYPGMAPDLPVYFTSCAAHNNRHIFISNANGVNENGDCIVYVFDWDCNLVKKLNLGYDIYHKWLLLDEVNNLLYTYNLESEKIFCYDLNSVGL
ncbi:MAG: hypothetical protein LBD59_02855 [Prevotellaceae bacterium]|jgi:hypothetical protein|nr:hypothetical protein [Prevotellaceae bacterium]